MIEHMFADCLWRVDGHQVRCRCLDRKSSYKVLGTFLAVDELGLPIESSSRDHALEMNEGD